MNTRRIVVLNFVIILVIVAAGFVGYYFYNQAALYISTDDAQVSDQQIVIAAPAAGQLTSWNGTTGTTWQSGDTLGQLQTNGTSLAITMPQPGTIVQTTAVTHEFVEPGEPLAYAYNLKTLFVTANIKETQIQGVKVGDSVDVYADAFPGTSITGTVSQICLATASTFSLLPTETDTANFTKVTQVIPVTISLQNPPGGLVPGMSVTVRIHKTS